MAQNKLLDAAGLKIWILTELGAPVIKVELAQEHLDVSVDDAVHWFSAKKGVHKQVILRLVAGQTTYPIPPEIDTITDISFPGNPNDFSVGFAPWILPEQQIPQSVIGAHGISGGLYSNWTQALQYIETAKRTLSMEEDWRQDGRTLYLFATRGLSGNFLIDYKSTDFTIEQLNERDHSLLKRYALARSMQILGRIRSKYDGYPGASGSVTLDGGQMLSDAQATMEALDEEIITSGYPMGILIG